MTQICKNSRLALILVLLSLAILPQRVLGGEKTIIDGFQKAHFGDSYKKLASIFHGISKPGKGRVTMLGKDQFEVLGRKDAVLALSLIDDKLYQAAVAYEFSPDNLTSLEHEFDNIKTALIQKYGEPDGIDQPRETLADQDFTLTSLRSGKAIWIAEWEDKKNDRKVRMMIGKKNALKLQVLIGYVDNVLKETADKAEAEKHASEL